MVMEPLRNDSASIGSNTLDNPLTPFAKGELTIGVS